MTKTKPKNVADALVDSLIKNGIENLYCLPGIQNDRFFDALYARRDELTPIHTRHEQGAVYMALGAALATGNPQAFCIVPGPGFLNGAAALSTAYAVNAPLMALIGQIPSRAIGKDFGLLHEINGQLDMLNSLTKDADRICAGEHAAEKMNAAWTKLLSGRPRPVGLEVPVDIWQSELPANQTILKPDAAEPLPIDPKQIEAAVGLIESARHPMIFVGAGAQAHSEAVWEFAAANSAAVVAFRTGHGVVSSRDDLSIGLPEAHALWTDCDLVIGLGTRLQTPLMQWGFDPDLKMIHIDIDETSLNKITPATVAINADIGDALPLLNAAIVGGAGRRSDWRRQIKETKQNFARKYAEKLAPQLSWLSAIRDVLPEDGILVDELTQIGFVSRFAFPVYQPRTFLSSGYQGTLGWGIPTALGAAHARRDVPVVAISGDGGGMFGIAELATARHHNIPLTVIIMNDNAFGNVRSIQRDDYGGRYIASDLTSPDFVKLAESFGVDAMKAHTPDELRAGLGASIERRSPAVIEVPVGEFPSPWEFILMPKVRGN